eukprot:TRINITY_DN11306_c0_g1_i1.p1 TRINITY_DN11306_c0_g1~~TRINITY_DN11306_c0_g1_i1.p1  ORF type:complete len:346 (-),score=59.89 TRINITY_DN11306_c0_g1_i1:361-1341(-)
MGLFDSCKFGQGAKAPHPLPKGKTNAVCPITGLSADGASLQIEQEAAQAYTDLVNDPDVAEERRVLSSILQGKTAVNATDSQGASSPLTSFEPVPLNVQNGKHVASSHTRELVRAVGLATLRRFTASFYKKAFADPHLDQFIRVHHDEHGERFALWIAEKFGDGAPWTEKRKSRPSDVMKIEGRLYEVAHDRSSAHFAAWHSPKRAPEKWGQHFKPDDARVWMRLHFWAAREVGLFEPRFAAFMDYYMRFIGHFISIYSSAAPPFVRESARWSADQCNIDRYIAAGNRMQDVIDKPLADEIRKLPRDEQLYTGSKQATPAWPYDRW